MVEVLCETLRYSHRRQLRCKKKYEMRLTVKFYRYIEVSNRMSTSSSSDDAIAIAWTSAGLFIDRDLIGNLLRFGENADDGERIHLCYEWRGWLKRRCVSLVFKGMKELMPNFDETPGIYTSEGKGPSETPTSARALTSASAISIIIASQPL